MNIVNALVGGAEGFLMSGGNVGAALEGAVGMLPGTTAANMTGEIGNGALGALDAQSEAFQVSMYGEQVRHQERMQAQSQAFDEMIDEKSEQMREINTLRDVQMAQRKADNAITKKFIQSITEE